MLFENKFTARAECALRAAHESAAEMGHGYVGSEHVLLGILKNPESHAARLLEGAGVKRDSVVDTIYKRKGRGVSGINTEQGLTPCAKRIVSTAYMRAKSEGACFVGTEHLLFGMLEEKKSSAMEILADMNVDCGKLCRVLLSSGESNSEYKRAAEGRQIKEKSDKLLKNFGKDLCALAREGEIDPVVGREKEISRIIGVLARRTKNNPVLLGDPGVGKTAVVEGLAAAISQGNVPRVLSDKRIFMLDMPSVIAGTKYRGEFEERVKTIIREVGKMKDIILFIDEIHTIVGAGSAEGAIDAANILKPALARREIQIIGATTFEEYKKHIERDAALERRFAPITVEEPDAETTFEILSGICGKYEEHHKVRIPEKAIRRAIELSLRYINDRKLPDKAIDIIDEAASRISVMSSAPPARMAELENALRDIRYEKGVCVREENFAMAQKLLEKEQELSKELAEISERWHGIIDGKAEVSEKNIEDVVGEKTGVPVARISEGESERLQKLEAMLSERVVGQSEAISAVSRAIRRNRCGLSEPTKPIGSFLFAGPTGVGKTELCRALAECWFGDVRNLIKIDMSEYMERHELSKIIGSPPGYVGHNDCTTLVDRLRRAPYSVVVFDEIEKAHPDVFNILLQILDEGNLTDSSGRKADFKNSIVVMTSNCGAEKFSSVSVGFNEKGFGFSNVKKSVLGEIKHIFRPELINRIDEIVVFERAGEREAEKITELMLKKTIKRAADREIELEICEDAKKIILKHGFDEKYGARKLRRVIQNELEAPLADTFLANGMKKGKYRAYEFEGRIMTEHTE